MVARSKKTIAYLLAVALLVSSCAFPIKVSALTVSKRARTWHLDYTDVQEAWDYIDKYKSQHPKRKFKKVKVATIDTGAQLTHKDLRKNLDLEHCVDVTKGTTDFPRYDNVMLTHGTTSAGIIAATSNNGFGATGVAAGNKNNLIELMAIKAFDDEVAYSEQGNARTEDIIKGLDYAYQNGARVVYLCFGHQPGSRDAYGNIHNDVLLEKKIDELVANGVVVVCPAGNRNTDEIWYPSDFSSCISVISTSRYRDINSICKSSSSSYGIMKDISAPGRNIYSLAINNKHQMTKGTSTAAAVVSGVVAMMLYVNPNLTVDKIKSILYRSATDLYTKGYDIYTGYGNVNAYSAVTAATGHMKRIRPRTAETPRVKVGMRSAHTIALRWKKVKRATKYIVYQYQPTTSKFKRIGETTVNRFTVEDLDASSKYRFKVKVLATSIDGKRMNSKPSKPVQATTRKEPVIDPIIVDPVPDPIAIGTTN